MTRAASRQASEAACRPARWPSRRTRRDESGVAAIEFALLLPFLALLVFGTVDVGRAYLIHEQMKNAAREGAAFAQNNPLAQWDDSSGSCTNPNNISYKANAENGGTALTIQVTVGSTVYGPNTSGTGHLICDVLDSPPGPGTNVTVKTSKTFTPLTPFIKLATVSSSVTVQETR
jgi:Flp pilus assembly protein TadG